MSRRVIAANNRSIAERLVREIEAYAPVRDDAPGRGHAPDEGHAPGRGHAPDEELPDRRSD